MPAIMRINQAGLGAGTDGVARTDGLATGALVSILSMGGGVTSLVELLWVPSADTTSVSSLTQTGPTTWTFSPTAGAYGSWRVKLTIDQGLPTESSQIRIFGVRTPNRGMLIPSANERADPAATLLDQGASRIDDSENNEPTTAFPLGSAFGWTPAIEQALLALDSGSGPNPILFEWNGIDTTQWDTTNPGMPTPAVTAGWVAPTMAFVADVAAPGGGFLQVRATTGAAAAAATWWLPDDVPFADIGTIEIDLRIDPTRPAQPGDTFFAGIIYAGDDVAGFGIEQLYGYDAAGAMTSVVLHFGAGTGVIAYSLPLAATTAYTAAHRMVFDPKTDRGDAGAFPPDGYPRVKMDLTVTGPATATLGTPESGILSSEVPAWLPWEAGWGASSCNRIGIHMQTLAGAPTGPLGIDIFGIRVLRKQP